MSKLLQMLITFMQVYNSTQVRHCGQHGYTQNALHGMSQSVNGLKNFIAVRHIFRLKVEMHGAVFHATVQLTSLTISTS